MSELRDIEEKLAFVERHVEELDVLVRELFERLERGHEESTRWRAEMDRRFQALSEEHTPEDDVPPHWGQK